MEIEEGERAEKMREERGDWRRRGRREGWTKRKVRERREEEGERTGKG